MTTIDTIKSKTGRSLSTFKITDKTKIDAHIDFMELNPS
jgi:hypothetical protein